MAVCAEAMESLRVSRLYSIGGVKRPDVGSVDVDAWYSSWERAASKLAAVALDIADCRSTVRVWLSADILDGRRMILTFATHTKKIPSGRQCTEF